MARFFRLGVTVAALILLTGCASPGENDSSADIDELDAAPAAGVQIDGDGYSYSVPEGWDIPDADASALGTDTLAADLTDADGFSDNVNVVLSPAGAVTPDQVETLGVEELERGGATDVKVDDRVRVAGSESAHLSGSLTSEGSAYTIEQYYLTRDDQTYVVTFSFSADLERDDREDTAESILASWAWA